MNAPDSFSQMRRRGQEQDGEQTLQRTLGTGQLLLLGVGAIVGSGIFVATGNVAAHNTGPAIVYSFGLAALACVCAGLCYAEFAAIVPVSGSAYTYVYAAFGRLTGWLIGWCLVLEYTMAAATVAVGWSGYLGALARSVRLPLTPALASSPFGVSATGDLVRTAASWNIPATGLLIALTALLLKGVQFSTRVNSLLVATKLVVIALFIVCGARFVEPVNWHPFLPANTGTYGSFGWSGVLRGAAVVFYAYLGFDTVSTAARETRNPQTGMPIGIIGSLLLCTTVYVLFSLVLTGLAPYSLLAGPNPASIALDHAGAGLRMLKVAVEMGAVTGLTSVELALIYGLSRIVYAMARDGLMPSVLRRIGPSSHVPSGAILSCGLVAALLAGLFPLDVLGELISIGTLCAFVVVCSGVFFLRITRPNIIRPFKTPLAMVVCPAGALICTYLLTGLPAATWTRFLAWTAVGLCVYIFYGRRRGLDETP